MEQLLNLLAGTYLGALESGAHTLATYSLPILAVAALVNFYREWWPVVLRGGSQMGEALGQFLLLVVTVGFYQWLILHLWDLGQAAFDTFAQWGMLGSGNGLSAQQLRNPGFIMALGMQLAFPLAEQASWFSWVWQSVNLVVHPSDWIMAICIVLAFLAIAAHHLFLLVEFYLALMCAAVLVPWGIWRTTAHLAEFSLGWITGALIRALVSCVMIGLSLPLFDQIRTPPTSTSAFDVLTYVQAATPVFGSVIFAILCWVLPSRAARLAGGASLGLTASTVMSGAMTTVRFGQMSAGVVQGTSRMLRAVGI